MTHEEYARLMERCARNLVPPEPYVPPHERELLELEERDPTEWQPWQPRQVERPARNPESSKAAHAQHDSVIARQLEALEARYERDKAGIRRCLEAVCDEAGAAAGRLRKQISEQKAQIDAQQTAINEMRGEIALLKGLQPKRLMRKGAPPTTIEGSLANASQNLN
jgi:hypothetical protein